MLADSSLCDKSFHPFALSQLEAKHGVCMCRQRSELANEIGELNTQVKDVGGCSAEVKACSTGVVGEAPRGELVDRMNSLQHTVDALEQKLAACTALVCGLTNNDWEHTTDLEKRIVKLEACVTSLKRCGCIP